MRVFISHSSKDKPAVEALAAGLRARGIDAWLDIWEIAPGDDIVDRINQGLQQADAGVIVFSEHSRASRWVDSEVSYLTFARICEGKVLIPVTIDDNAWVPPLLRPLARRGSAKSMRSPMRCSAADRHHRRWARRTGEAPSGC